MRLNKKGEKSGEEIIKIHLNSYDQDVIEYIKENSDFSQSNEFCDITLISEIKVNYSSILPIFDRDTKEYLKNNIKISK